MAVKYSSIIKQAAIRVGQGGSIKGSQPAALDNAYASFDASVIDSGRFPYQAFSDACLLAEEKIAQVVAASKNNPYRTYLRSVTDELAHRDQLPTEDENGDPIIGVPGAVMDASDGMVLAPTKSPQPAQAIERMVRNIASGLLKVPYYLYAIEGSIILHTRDEVVVEVCVYSKEQQQTEIDADRFILFPDAFEELYICTAIAYLFVEDETPDTVKQYVGYSEQGLKMLDAGEIVQ